MADGKGKQKPQQPLGLNTGIPRSDFPTRTRTRAGVIPIPTRKYHGVLRNPRIKSYPRYIND